MEIDDRDLAYLIDMCTACVDIAEFISGCSFERFAHDKLRRFATEKALQILGEAANHVSQNTQGGLPEIDWARIVALRNKISHEYGEIPARRI